MIWLIWFIGMILTRRMIICSCRFHEIFDQYHIPQLCSFVLPSSCLFVRCPFFLLSGFFQLSRCPIVLLSHCWVVSLTRCPIVPLSHCPIVQLSGCPVVWMSGYLDVRLSRCPFVPLSRCLVVSLPLCPYIRLYRCPIVLLWCSSVVMLSCCPVVCISVCLIWPVTLFYRRPSKAQKIVTSVVSLTLSTCVIDPQHGFKRC